MEVEAYLAIARSLERLGIVAVSGVSIWAGYRLFRVVTEARANAEIEGHGVKLTMSQVGPGVFFALFGAIVLIYALASPIKVHPKDSDGSATTGGVVYDLDNVNKPSYSGAMGAINRVRLLAAQAGMKSLTGNERKQLVSASENLAAAKNCLMDSEFGAGTFAEYQVILGVCEKDPVQCDSYLKAKNKVAWFEKVDEFSNATNR